MDPKKQALNPELKQIYDKVMNTQIKPQSAGALSSSPSITPTVNTPPIPKPPSTPFTAPLQSASAASAPFGSAPAAPHTSANPIIPTAKVGKKIPMPLILVGVIVVIVVWGVAWAKFFGLF